MISGRMKILSAALVLATTAVAAADIPFDVLVVDPLQAGDCKILADIDGDGQLDPVIGGMPNEPLTWYRYPSWTPTKIAVARMEFTTDCAAADIDGDGAPDIVVPDGNNTDNLVWFRNPRPRGDTAWERLVIGSVGGWGKDVEVADYDRDGRLDVATRSHDAAMIFFQSADGWLRVPLPVTSLGREGMASGDIDGDGAIDLVFRGVWLENPGVGAQDGRRWQTHVIGAAPDNFKAAVGDVDGDGRNDVAFSSSEDTADVTWWSAQRGDPRAAWTAHRVAKAVERAHTLQIADMDGDGAADILVGQLHTARDHEIAVFRNADRAGTRWERQAIDNDSIHNGVVGDVDGDGDIDLFGAGYTGHPPARLWLNRSSTKTGVLAPDHWTPLRVTDHHRLTFGLGFGALRPGHIDIVSGGYVYLDPDEGLDGRWRQIALPAGYHAFGVTDVDGDDRPDIIAQKTTEGALQFYWLEAQSSGLDGWTATRIGEVPPASHSQGAQGYRIAQVEPGGRPEIAISSGNGIHYFRIPADPATGDWPQVHVSTNPSDEGFDVVDLDQDGYPDVVATTGERLGVEWYRNPGDGSDSWAATPVGTFTGSVFPDRVGAADLNGDGRPDIVVTEENGKADHARTVWWEQSPAGPGGAWRLHELATQASTNSMDLGDVDRDGDVDVVTAEHRGDLRVILWRNDGQGNFTPVVIGRGRESHLGARLVDLDQDGDLDVVSIAYDQPDDIWLWRNDSIPGSTGTMGPGRRGGLLSTLRSMVGGILP